LKKGGTGTKSKGGEVKILLGGQILTQIKRNWSLTIKTGGGGKTRIGTANALEGNEQVTRGKNIKKVKGLYAGFGGNDRRGVNPKTWPREKGGLWGGGELGGED